ncbi:MAG: hypothetical protein GYB32_07795, partial [Algicola sp.]|nr:hypothetical protein [Algicola sp.]
DGYINPSLEIIEENNYYPFGLKHKGYNNMVTSTNIALKKTYNGKEIQDELGLDWYDYGARNYDASLGRFMNIDRFAEKYENMNPYQYTFNNPIRFIDVNGDYVFIGINNDDGDQIYSVLYDGGKAYHYTKDNNGKITKGEEYDGASNFVAQATKTLDKLKSSGKTGKGLVNYFSGANNNITIRSGEENYEKGGVVNLNLNRMQKTNTTDGYTDSPFHVSLGHELAHRVDKNTRRNTEWAQPWIGRAVDSEIYASHIENMIRTESGMPLRTHYGTLLSINGDKKSYSGNEKGRLIDMFGNSFYYNDYGKRINPRPSVTNNIYGGEIYENRYNYYINQVKSNPVIYSKI